MSVGFELFVDLKQDWFDSRDVCCAVVVAGHQVEFIFVWTCFVIYLGRFLKLQVLV